MNVQEMLEEIPKRYPLATIKTIEGMPEHYFLELNNKWILSVGYSKFHYCDAYRFGLSNPMESTTVELAIFRPDGEWYISESMIETGGTGVLGWQNSDQVFEILDYVSRLGD